MAIPVSNGQASCNTLYKGQGLGNYVENKGYIIMLIYIELDESSTSSP